MAKRERIRDPVHDLIEFDLDDPLERVCWDIVQSRPFQRLRKIKQLGFSELVYPGATHSRLAHSLGAFHTARHMTEMVATLLGNRRTDSVNVNGAIAAALVHDIGHGPFSHAFEHALKSVGLEREHEEWTVKIINETELNGILARIKPGFHRTVTKMIANKDSPDDLYCSIVSSQFDADRLDYMRRDRLMTGTQQGAIDFRWLLANLEVGVVKVGVDDQQLPKDAQTFVLGPKAVMAAETYVLGLFHLYPTVYMHKTTRGVEAIFSALLAAVITKIRGDQVAATALPPEHPIVLFAQSPDDLDRYLALDDTVISGALPLLKGSPVPRIAQLAERLLQRRLYKCIDVSYSCAVWARKKADGGGVEDAARVAKEAEVEIRKRVSERGIVRQDDEVPLVLDDFAKRDPYKRVLRDESALNRIWAIGGDGKMYDLGDLSPVVKSLVSFEAYRMYYADDSGKQIIENLIGEVLQ